MTLNVADFEIIRLPLTRMVLPVTVSKDQSGEPPAHGNLRLGRRHLPASALGTDLRAARILVQARAEFHVVAPAAPIAEERFSGCHVSALEAVPHWFISKNGFS